MSILKRLSNALPYNRMREKFPIQPDSMVLFKVIIKNPLDRKGMISRNNVQTIISQCNFKSGIIFLCLFCMKFYIHMREIRLVEVNDNIKNELSF